jgi:hypothetical protein
VKIRGQGDRAALQGKKRFVWLKPIERNCLVKKVKSPTNNANSKVTRTMLAIWPKMRVIATAEDAAPRNLFSTEPIIAFTLGVENKLNPKPVMSSANIIRGSESSLP